MKGDDPNAIRVVLVTHRDADEAKALATQLVTERLAACVNVVPGVTSVYRWQGAIREDAEALMVIKTAEHRIGPLKHRIAKLHPYENPEILILPTDGGSRKYLDWVVAETAPHGREDAPH
ncbi:MAG: divalent-cation tolerance protein CutA [Nitrospirae bacterium]|nr:divalent-cation tolerance protein CutA [Nitrospirota bacterium]